MDPKRLLIARGYWKDAGEEGSDTGGTGAGEDRGDDFVPTEETPEEQAERTGADLEEEEEGADPKKKDEPKKDEPKKDEPKKDTKAKKDDPDADSDEDDEGDDKGGDKKKPGGLPWSRHKELMKAERQKNEELAKRLQKYEQGDRIAVVNEEIKTLDTQIVTLEQEYNELVGEGKTKEAAAKMADIRKTERERNNKTVALATQEATSRAIERVRYDTTLERLEAAHPEINEEHEDFDEGLRDDVARLARSFVAEGNTPSDALQKAAKRLLKATTKAQKDAQDVKPKVDEKDVKKEIESKRKADAVDKAADTLKKQPPDTSKMGSDADKAGGTISAKDVMRMDQKDFNKLDDKTLARLRGDEI